MAGLFIDPEKPYLGASPDSIVVCKCCGKRVLEVKCPMCVRDGLPDDDHKTFCMTKLDDQQTWVLKRNHAYYFQVQLQMAVCKVKYCDFVVWNEKGFILERIAYDKELYETHVNSVKHLFIYGILPEIVGKFYTRKPVSNSEGLVPIPRNSEPSSVSTSDENCDFEDPSKLWCYCNEPGFGEMIMCDNQTVCICVTCRLSKWRTVKCCYHD